MKILKRLLSVLLLAILSFGIYYAWRAFPIISGYGAKNLCSCVMIGNRNPEDVIANELGGFPLSVGSFSVDYNDSSATASVFGTAKRKAIYRKGLGCTLVVEISEEEIRKQNFSLVTRPVINQDTIAWPAGNKVSDSIPAEVDSERLAGVVALAFEEPGEKPLRRTRAILIVYKGQIIAEKYAKGFDKDSKQLGWSMTKSLTNAMIGALVMKGKISVDDTNLMDVWTSDDRKNITLNNLMQMSSGLEWEENYAGPSGATNMLFKKKDMGLYAANSKLKNEPGNIFYYSSGTTNIISRIIRNTVGDEDYHRFGYREVFNKIGMYSLVIEPDAGGTFVGSSYSWATARDWARFGLLYLNTGYWEGEKILPEGWTAYTSTPTKSADRGQYGAQFWLNAGGPQNPSNRFYPDVPEDLYWADGFEGQNVFIIPSQQLVVVKLSQSQGNYLDDNAFLRDVISCLGR